MAPTRRLDRRLGFTLIEVLVVLVLLYVVLGHHVCVVPPHASTGSAMTVAKRRVIRHVAEHGELPRNLAATAELEGYIDGLDDGWGEPLRFTTADGVVTLRSAGPDGQWITEDDVVGQFAVWDADGDVMDELGPWIQDPHDRPGG